MRDVRRRERLAGLKRTSKREDRGGSGKKSVSKQQKSPDQSDDGGLPLRKSSTPEKTESAPVMDVVKASSWHHPVRWPGRDTMSSRALSPQAVPSSWFFDPFCTLPGASEMPSMVDHLISYCK